MPRRTVVCLSLCIPILSLIAVLPVQAASDIVLRAANVGTTRGNWTIVSDATAAGGQYLSSADNGWSSTSAPLASPSDYVEFTFTAPASTSYHVWFRLRAANNDKYNDSLWVQYSDATTTGGAAAYRIGTTSGLDVNLERCSGCGDSGWGWQDGAYWLSQTTTIQFASTGTHTLRIQTREDGVQIDQVVLSPSAYLYASPGSMTNDSTIVSPSGSSSNSAMVGPYLGTAVSLPGRVEAENFDTGGDGVSYHDSTTGNAGGAYRDTNADIEACSGGGFNLGWIAAGEWANYAVNVTSAGTYTIKVRVASASGGGSMHVGFNGPSSVWTSVSVPSTGGWQTWTTVSFQATLGAGNQLMTLLFDTPGFNVDYVEVAPVSSTSGGSGGSGGSSLSVVTWNIHIADSSTSHAQGAIDRIVSMSPQPQVVVLEEAHQSLYDTYLGELRSKTGKTWSGAFQSHCPSGAWTGSSCSSTEDEGVAVFTSLPVTSSSRTYLPYADQWHSARGMVRLAVTFNGVTLQVFGIHLQSDATARHNSMSYIKSYASNYAAPQIAGGDFNADMDQIDSTSGMYSSFVDTWKVVGSGSGYTCNTPSPTMKLDYWFTDAGRRAQPQSTSVVTSTGTFSDHYPVLTVFSVQ